MLPYPRTQAVPAALTARVIGVGNAGVHLADRVAMLGPRGVEVLAANTDAQSLAASLAPRKAVLGGRATRGLGAGGDPEVGAEAARETIEEIRFAVEGAQVVIVVAGLGGGTGSGAAPLVAEAARQAGAFVVGLVTLPFAFEGRRRALQAADAADALSRHTHALLRFENDQMAGLSSPRAGIGETFAAADELLSTCVVAFMELVSGRGPMPVQFGNLMSVLGAGGGAAVFGRGEATGENRAHDAVERALKSPLLDRGRVLQQCHAIVAGIGGPPSLSFAETAAIMEALGRNVPEGAQLYLGVSTVPDPQAPLSVTLFGACGEPAAAPAQAPPQRAKSPARAKHQPTPQPVSVAPGGAVAPSVPERAAEPEPPDPLHPKPPGRLLPDDPGAAPAKQAAKPATGPRVKQETLQFEPAARGRFEKIEPTIVEGEDLDVPTFLRLGGRK